MKPSLQTSLIRSLHPDKQRESLQKAWMLGKSQRWFSALSQQSLSSHPSSSERTIINPIVPGGEDSASS
jgi:hypothetical protein